MAGVDRVRRKLHECRCSDFAVPRRGTGHRLTGYAARSLKTAPRRSNKGVRSCA